jgi:glycosyltransferase involved in cell wall biosynthesis
VASRILCIDDGLQLWGAQQVLRRIALPLRAEGIELVLGAPAESDLMRSWTGAGLPATELHFPMPPAPRTPDGRLRWKPVAQMLASSPAAIARVRRAARQVGADALLANSHATQLDTAIAGRHSRLPVVLYLHEELPYRLGRVLRTAATHLAGQTVAVSAPVLHQIPLQPKSRAHVVANGVDTGEFFPGDPDLGLRKELGAGPDELLLVAVTRLDPVKRIEDLIRAAASLPSDLPWRLCIVGETTAFSEYAADMIRLAQRLEPDRICFAGRRPDIPDVMRAADIVVHTGSVEGLPLGLLEAQASARPVVAYRVAGVGSLVDDGVSGVLVDEGDVHGVADGLRRLLADDDLRLRQGTAAVARVRARFDLRSQTAGLVALWGSL